MPYQPNEEILVVPFKRGVVVQILDIPTGVIRYAQRYSTQAGAQRAVRRMMDVEKGAPIPTYGSIFYLGALSKYNLGVDYDD